MAKRPEIIDKLKEIAARPGVTVPWERITINRWKPDTCKCVIEQWFDDDAEPRVVTYANILSTCPEHTATGEPLWIALNGENQRKNAVLAIVEALVGKEAREDKTTWAFTTEKLSGKDERVLEITVAGATKTDKDGVESATDLQFGIGVVKVL